MTLKKAAGMALALLGLALALFKSGGLRLGAERASDPKLTASSITGIELRRPDASCRFERKHHGWRLADPPDAPADNALVHSILEHALALQAGGAFPLKDAPESREAYGLEPPELEIVLSDGSVTAQLRFGKLNKLSKRRYAELSGLGHTGTGFVFLVPEAQFSRLNRTRDDLRDRRPLKADPQRVRSLVVRRSSGELILERAGESGWTVRAGERRHSADSVVVEDLLKRLVALRALEFADSFTEETAAEFGLHRPVLTFSLHSDAGSSVTSGAPEHPNADDEPLTVQVGTVLAAPRSEKPAAEGEERIIPDLERRFYFRVLGYPWVYRAGLAGPLDDLLKEPAFFRERAPFASLKGIGSLKLSVPGLDRIDLKLRESRWTLNRGSDVRSIARGAWEKELLSRLGRIRALSYNGTASPRPIGPDETVIEVADSEGAFREIVIGRGLNRDGPGAADAQSEESPREGYVHFGADTPLQAVYPAEALPEVRAVAAFVEERLSQSQ